MAIVKAPIIASVVDANLYGLLSGPQALGPTFFENLNFFLPGMQLGDNTMRLDALGATWGPEGPGKPFEFFVLNKIKNSHGLNWKGGRIVGTFSPSATWSRMHDAYALVVEDSSELTVQFLRVHNTGDGISFNRGADQPIVSKCHLSMCRDDAFQNDFHNANVIIEDCLIDGCFIFFSSRPYAAGLPDSSGVTPTRIENCLVRLVDMPTTFLANGQPGHGRFFKMDKSPSPIDPKIQLINNIFRVDTPHVCCGDFMMPPASRIDVCTGNIMVWGGQGAWPYATEAGWTVTTDTTVWDNARRAWFDARRLEGHPAYLYDPMEFPVP